MVRPAEDEAAYSQDRRGLGGRVRLCTPSHPKVTIRVIELPENPGLRPRVRLSYECMELQRSLGLGLCCGITCGSGLCVWGSGNVTRVGRYSSFASSRHHGNITLSSHFDQSMWHHAGWSRLTTAHL